jgi:hypothetical protein
VPVLTIGLTIGLVLLGAACGDDGSSGADSTTTTETADTTSTTTTTSTTQPPTTVTLAPPELADFQGPTGPVCTTLEEAAASLHDAWAAGDPVAGVRCATGPAMQTLFGSGATGPADSEFFAGCFPDESPALCSYAYEGGAINFSMSSDPNAGAVVQAVSFLAD